MSIASPRPHLTHFPLFFFLISCLFLTCQRPKFYMPYIGSRGAQTPKWVLCLFHVYNEKYLFLIEQSLPKKPKNPRIQSRNPKKNFAITLFIYLLFIVHLRYFVKTPEASLFNFVRLLLLLVKRSPNICRHFL